MLLGEFDFVDLMVDDPTTHWMAKVLFATVLIVMFCILAYLYFANIAKVLFAAFLVVMSIVLMNLVVGLAISDITALRSNSLCCL